MVKALTEGTHFLKKFFVRVIIHFILTGLSLGTIYNQFNMNISFLLSFVRRLCKKNLMWELTENCFKKNIFQSALGFNSLIPTYSQTEICVCPSDLARIICVLCGWKRILVVDSSLCLLASLLVITNVFLDYSSMPFKNQKLF